MITFAFPGQGSQRKGMGAALFARFPDVVRAADAILGYSIAEICAAGGPRLNQTEFTQPAVFVLNKLIHMAFVQAYRVTPNWLIGHSLGELNALEAAGCLGFAAALEIVAARGRLMASRNGQGTMAAVVGERTRILELAADAPDVHVANDNSPTQVVVAGTQAALAAFAKQVEQRGWRYLPLPVSGAFHSPLMAGLDGELGRVLERVDVRPPAIPVISNYTARPYQSDAIRSLLVAQLTHPVRWVESVQWLAAEGPVLFEEMSATPILSPMIRAIVRD